MQSLLWFLLFSAIGIPNKFLSQAMHAGVIRDMENQRIKKERQADFDMQRAMEDEYKKILIPGICRMRARCGEPVGKLFIYRNAGIANV